MTDAARLFHRDGAIDDSAGFKMAAGMTEEANALLADAVAAHGGWYVDAENILTVAQMIKDGLLGANDTYEGVSVVLTNKGLEMALFKGLIAKDHYLLERLRAESAT